MRLNRSPPTAVAIAAFAIALAGLAHAGEGPPRNDGAGVTYAPRAAGPGEQPGFQDLSEDAGSGAGFYPLPKQYRDGARNARAGAAADREEAIGAAIASTAVEDEFDEGYYFGNSHSVFNPVDGVGTPFFGGYYGR